jgi:hypothetical protein
MDSPLNPCLRGQAAEKVADVALVDRSTVELAEQASASVYA